jgi:hypothetical protein
MSGNPMHQFGRRFIARRNNDPSGVSGTGIVACGVEFSDGQVVLSWLTRVRSIGVYPSMEALEKVHGHGGDTVIEWVDP